MTGEHRTATGEILGRLLATRGITRYATFLTQGEGKYLPGGVESLSGYVLSGGGEVYGFWLDWDEDAGRYVLDPWYRVEDVSQFDADPEYGRARQRLGLNNHRGH